jgi:hypothetical protein
VPWCEECSRFYNPNSLNADGTCPTCGRQVGEPLAGEARAVEDKAKVPWHFWLLLIALAIYLGWRLIQGLSWLADRL